MHSKEFLLIVVLGINYIFLSSCIRSSVKNLSLPLDYEKKPININIELHFSLSGDFDFKFALKKNNMYLKKRQDTTDTFR